MSDIDVEVVPETPAPVPTPKAPKKRKAAPKKAAPKAAKKAKGKANGKQKRSVDASKLDQFGFRLGSIKSKAATMYAGKHGATLAEVKSKLKSTQYNLLTELEKNKGFKVKREEEAGDNNRKVTRFFIVAR